MNRFTKKDYFLGLVAGFLTGLFFIPVLVDLEISLPYRIPILLLGFPTIIVIGLWIAGMLSRWISIFYQFSKFIATGFLNVAIDFGILNIFIFITGVSAGPLFSLFKGVSFIAANINSYFWNKYWTFRKRIPFHLESLASDSEIAPAKKFSKEYLQFLVVSIVGLTINVGVASFIVNGIEVQFGFSPAAWANIGAFAGSIAGLFWNFIGYKLIVFKV